MQTPKIDHFWGWKKGKKNPPTTPNPGQNRKNGRRTKKNAKSKLRIHQRSKKVGGLKKVVGVPLIKQQGGFFLGRGRPEKRP